ncbi:hypothetical protein LTR22_016210 [Elasticomyces elasticus]|nr:hypothetical protein LTR22_016210 [Elasticomyces elasticus]KAK4914314.1 hypothetical protein LTR49_017452 [Elasticomyces elasticus]
MAKSKGWTNKRPPIYYSSYQRAERAEQLLNSTKDQLSARGVRFDHRVGAARLTTMLKLAGRGLLCYTNCDKIELLGFCRARGIKGPSVNSKGSKKNVVAALERADANARFGYFFKLPAELRLLIVEAAGVEYDVVEQRAGEEAQGA